MPRPYQTSHDPLCMCHTPFPGCHMPLSGCHTSLRLLLAVAWALHPFQLTLIPSLMLLTTLTACQSLLLLLQGIIKSSSSNSAVRHRRELKLELDLIKGVLIPSLSPEAIFLGTINPLRHSQPLRIREFPLLLHQLAGIVSLTSLKAVTPTIMVPHPLIMASFCTRPGKAAC